MTDRGDVESTRAPQRLRIASWATALAIGATIGLLCIPVRVWQLQHRPGDQLAAAVAEDLGVRTPQVRRGDLLDRRGRVLATTSLGWRAFIDPALAKDPALLGVRVQQTIGVSAIEVQRRLSGRLHRRYIPLPGLLEDWQVERLRVERIPGVGLERRAVRHYPLSDTAQSLVGTVGFEHDGLSGLEHALHTSLDSARGRIVSVRDVRRRTMWIPPDGFEPGKDGETVRLSIDLVIQRMAESRLEEAVAAYGAAGGRVVIMDPATGELLAVADIDRRTEHLNPHLRRNRCVSDPYEPGSTFKPFVWAAATQAGLATPDEVLPTPTHGPHRTSFGRRIRDAHDRGPTSWRHVLVHSLNSGMAIVAERMSHGSLRRVVGQLGFGHATGCGIPGETIGIVTPSGKWSNYTQTSVAMGHEIAVTPIQMARAFSAFASEGRMPAATIQAVHDRAATLSVPVFDPGISDLTRATMQLVMREGTGKRVQSDQYSMFGKSGTAQLPKAEGGGYHEHRYVSSFIAGAPALDTRLVVLCIIDDPDRGLGRWYGGSTAGPVVRDLVDSVLPYLGVAPDRLQASAD
ncbi:MAG: penicillin-binding protein 2 [Phycisphaerales bacterium]|nr:penicillin-binding protein 2 [Phycisphaerales bacterium]